jgi:hypothetical protein
MNRAYGMLGRSEMCTGLFWKKPEGKRPIER